MFSIPDRRGCAERAMTGNLRLDTERALDDNDEEPRITEHLARSDLRRRKLFYNDWSGDQRRLSTLNGFFLRLIAVAIVLYR